MLAKVFAEAQRAGYVNSVPQSALGAGISLPFSWPGFIAEKQARLLDHSSYHSNPPPTRTAPKTLVESLAQRAANEGKKLNLSGVASSSSIVGAVWSDSGLASLVESDSDRVDVVRMYAHTIHRVIESIDVPRTRVRYVCVCGRYNPSRG